MSRVRGLALMVLGASLMAGAVGGTAAAAPADQQTTQVAMTQNPFVFAPASITVQAGTRVTWTSQTGLHTTTSDGGLWDSGIVQEGGSFSFTFNTPGTYTYFCLPHRSLGMTGTVVVAAAQAAPAPQAPPVGGAAPSASPGVAAPSQLPRTGEADSNATGAGVVLALGAALAGLGWLVRRRGAKAS